VFTPQGGDQPTPCGTGITQGSERAPGAGKCFLYQVFSKMPVPAQPEGIPVQIGRMSVHQGSELCLFGPHAGLDRCKAVFLSSDQWSGGWKAMMEPASHRDDFTACLMEVRPSGRNFYF